MRTNSLSTMARALCVAGLLAPAAPAMGEELLLGLFYDRTRDGHGIELHKAGDTYVVYLYTYDQTGNPEWFLGVADMDNGVIFGDFERYTEVQGNGSPFEVEADPDFDGEFRLDFSAGLDSPACNDGANRSGAEQVGSFYWRIDKASEDSEHGTWCMEFLRIGQEQASDPYHGGIWYKRTEPGFGFTMSNMDSTETALTYYYDFEGNPRWALGSGLTAAGSIPLNHFNGYCRRCTPRVPDTIPAGQLDLVWDDRGNPSVDAGTAYLELDYPNPPGGQFDKTFTLSRISDGESRDSVDIPSFWDSDALRLFRATWEEDRNEGKRSDIRGRRINDLGEDELQTASLLDGIQASPSIAMADDGSYVMVWEDDTDGNGFYQVVGALFNADGSLREYLGSLNEVGAGQQRYPDVAAAPDGRFVVVWEDDYDENGYYQIYAAGFDRNGNKTIADFDVNNEGAGNQMSPAVDMDRDGRFVVTWLDDQDVDEFYDVAVRPFNSNGSAIRDQVRVNVSTGGQRRDPDVAINHLGEYMVVWADDRDGNHFYEIYGRGFTSSGNQKFGRRTLNETSTASQYAPAVAATPDWGYVTAWVDQGYRIHAIAHTRDGAVLWDERKVNNSSATYVGHPAVAVSFDGIALVAWPYMRENRGFRLRGRPIDENGVFAGEVIISRENLGRAYSPAISASR